MKAKTKELLREAQQYCNDNDKSTEFMLQYMQDFANVDLDCVASFLREKLDAQWDKLENSELDKPFKPIE
jgi:hypothetical protein